MDNDFNNPELVQTIEDIVTRVKKGSLSVKKAVSEIIRDYKIVEAMMSGVRSGEIILPLFDTYKEEVTTYAQIMKANRELAEDSVLKGNMELLLNVREQRVAVLQKAFNASGLLQDAEDSLFRNKSQNINQPKQKKE